MAYDKKLKDDFYDFMFKLDLMPRNYENILRDIFYSNFLNTPAKELNASSALHTLLEALDGDNEKI